MQEPDYSRLDRLTHRVAFLNKAIQRSAADVEDLIWGSRYRDIPVERPIFITSVPRAGTTLLLEMLANSTELASHRYRDMPFILCPVLWDTLSTGFRLDPKLKERAHGDGMQISFDSPEAFEEVMWRAFWPEKFRGETISLWEGQEKGEEFKEFFQNHLRKIISVRSTEENVRTRYVSKNNANVARLSLLRELFPDSFVLVPFRNPPDQAESLRRQHLRFLEIHRANRFSKAYMRDLGHLEFGELHQPIGFPGMEDVIDRFTPSDLDYWIGYWRVAYDHISRQKADQLFISLEALCSGGTSGFFHLADRLGLPRDSFPPSVADRLRPPPAYDIELDGLDAENLEGALSLYEQLSRMSVL